MREMFIGKGFSDYLSKPIEIAKLDEILAKWIPREKQQRLSASAVSGLRDPQVAAAALLPVIQGIDTARGLAMTGGGEAGYRRVLKSFYKDAFERLLQLKTVPDEQDLLFFTTQVHALKSAAATIGAAALSNEAAALETAGKAGNMAAIRERLPSFYEELRKTVEGIRKALEAKSEETEGSAEVVLSREDPRFRALKEALENWDIEALDRLFAELEKASLDEASMRTVETISDQVLKGEFETALKILLNSVEQETAMDDP